MNKNIATVIAAGAAVVVCITGWLAPSMLQGSQRAVEAKASLELERARRLLDKYSAGLTYESLLDRCLATEGVEVDYESLSEEAVDDYQQSHTEQWEAYQAKDWPEGSPSPRPARAGYGNIAEQIRRGLDGRSNLFRKNERLLKDALAAVDRALSITEGDVSSRTDAEANRLKGVILHHMGQARRMEALLLRNESDNYRRKLIALSTRVEEARKTTALVAESLVDERLSELRPKVAELESAISEDRLALEALDKRIGELESRLEVATSRRDEALEAMERLKAAGADFSDPKGMENFRNRLEELDGIFRSAAREAHAIEYGDYPKATIDRTGDFLSGRYVEEGSSRDVTIAHGLTHYRNERTILSARIAGRERQLDDLRTELARIEGIKKACAQSQDRAASRIAEAIKDASEAYAELNRVEAEAFTVEEAALELFDRSARISRQAATYSAQWIRDARDRTQGLSPEARERSAFNLRLQDGWMGGYTAAGEADSLLAKAWIQYARYDAAGRNVEILSRVAGVLQLGEADVESEQTKMSNAHDAGVEEIQAAVAALERAHRDTGRHWTLTAQAAGTIYLLALFGHEDYAGDAIEAYRNAVKGREDESFAQIFLARLNQLERRP